MILHHSEVITPEAEMARELITKWGPVMATAAGETSTGFPITRNLTPEEIVVKCCETAERTFEQFRARGWVKPLPSYEEMTNMVNPSDSDSE